MKKNKKRPIAAKTPISNISEQRPTIINGAGPNELAVPARHVIEITLARPADDSPLATMNRLLTRYQR